MGYYLSQPEPMEMQHRCHKPFGVHTHTGEMGCGLRKLKPSEESSPGKIYSTLKRPQVETKVGVAYTYHYVDFLVGKDEAAAFRLCSDQKREYGARK
ncbi:unnamed protein product [Coregonus sp. 'balchen']|nr:unnamed protein product [Coregonus sp. 'balchen']